ncbi:MAG: ATP-binding protein [Rickettsiales bacterium]
MTKEQEKKLNSPRIRYLIAFSAFIMLTFSFIVIYQGKNAYNQAIKDGEQNSVRLANILSEHVELSFLGVDLSLRRVIERQFFNLLFRNNIPQYTENDFRIWLNETPQIAGIALIDERGAVKVSAHKEKYEHWLEYQARPAGQQLFKQLRETDNNDVFIGKNHTVGKTPLILMSRRYTKLGGEFGGIVVAAIDPQYFINFYDSIASGNQKFMSIMLSDQTLLASSPYKSAINEFLGRNFLGKQERVPNAVFHGKVSSSDSNKIMALKFLKNMPIAIQITLDEDDYLTSWRQSRLRDIGFLVLFTIFGSILSFFAVVMARQIMRVQESESAAILASQAKSEFLANMSHELRTPLNAIIGFSEMINSGYFGPLNANQKERIYDINLCGNHLLQLITDILEFSKGDAGKLELLEEKVNLGDLVNESVRIMKGKVKTKNIDLIVRIDPQLPLLWGDSRKIRQILINLLSNAFKFTPENGVITASANFDSHKNLMLIVTDNGIGIAEGDIPKALSVFGQVHRAKNHEGTGLGLPLCKMYAELHDGKLVLQSKPNEGTTVKIVFPHQRTIINRQ